MSETTTEYGTPKTVCDTEPFPPQTGDLLGSYIARLSARVRQCEGYNAYMATLTERVAKLESMFKDMDENENDLCGQMNEYDIKHSKLRKRIKRIEGLVAGYETIHCAGCKKPATRKGYNVPEGWIAVVSYPHGRQYRCEDCKNDDCIVTLESKQAEAAPVLAELFGAAAQAACPEQSDFHRAHDYDLCECGHRAASHNCCDDGGVCRSWCNKQHCDCQGFRFSQPEAPAVTTPPACFRCKGPLGNKPILLSDDEDGWACEKCRGELYGNPQQESPAVTTPISELSDDGVAELRRWAKAGDSVNQPLLCATCGHDMDSHRRDGLRNGHKRKRWCDGGTLGKPCKCREFTPVASEG